MKNKILIICIVLTIAIGSWNCTQFLDAKPNNLLAHPNSFKDLRAILDNEDFVNHVYPALAEMGSDDFQITYNGYNKLPDFFRDTYAWNDNGIYEGDWTSSYRAISLANVVLEALDRINDKNTVIRNQLKGEAFFLRGWMFFNLAQVYCKPYTFNEPNIGLGLVLRMDSDSEINIGRSTLEDTYKQLFNDLNLALELLPDESEYVTRPSKTVVRAALSRAYLAIGDYTNAERMTKLALEKKSNLLDYNTVNSTFKYPFVLNTNTEVMYYGRTSSAGYFIYNDGNYIAEELYNLYDVFDLRKSLFFEKGAEGMKYRGFYHGDVADYSAVLATDELYLTMAECLARRGELTESLQYLNTLRKHRFIKENFVASTAANQDELIEKVLKERRIQLVYRGIRWLDLRRLNKDPKYAKVLERIMYNGQEKITYTLPPNDLRYTFLIPETAVLIGNYEQNPR